MTDIEKYTNLIKLFKDDKISKEELCIELGDLTTFKDITTIKLVQKPSTGNNHTFVAAILPEQIAATKKYKLIYLIDKDIVTDILLPEEVIQIIQTCNKYSQKILHYIFSFSNEKDLTLKEIFSNYMKAYLLLIQEMPHQILVKLEKSGFFYLDKVLSQFGLAETKKKDKELDIGGDIKAMNLLPVEYVDAAEALYDKHVAEILKDATKRTDNPETPTINFYDDKITEKCDNDMAADLNPIPPDFWPKGF